MEGETAQRTTRVELRKIVQELSKMEAFATDYLRVRHANLTKRLTKKMTGRKPCSVVKIS